MAKAKPVETEAALNLDSRWELDIFRGIRRPGGLCQGTAEAGIHHGTSNKGEKMKQKPPGSGKNSLSLIDASRLFVELGLFQARTFLDLG